MKHSISKLPRMAKGGPVKGVHKGATTDSGMSAAGMYQRTSQKEDDGKGMSPKFAASEAKNIHHKVLGEMKSMPKPKLYAEGGCVGSACSGCSTCMASGGYIPNPSEAEARSGYEVHKSEGGDIEDSEDGEVMEGVAGELLNAFETKNKKEILDAIKAIVLSCKE